MKKPLLPAIAALIFVFSAQAQKTVFKYPFEFEKSFLARGQYSTIFLDNASDTSFSLIIKDNKKVEYLWLSKDFKVIEKVSRPIESTILDKTPHKYVGGTANGGEYHFIYGLRSGYHMETVDFRNKAVTDRLLFELPSSEKQLASFSDLNMHYTVAADDKAGQLVLYSVGPSGELSQKRLSMTIPDDAEKHRTRLSEYLEDMQVFKSGENPDLSAAVKPVKLFSNPGGLSIVVNGGDNPTHIYTISLPDQSFSERTIDYGGLVSKEDKGRSYISSFQKENMLFSLILNKKSIRISVHELPSGRLLNKFEFTDESGDSQFAEYPVTEKRMGRSATAKDLDDIKKVIRAFTKGTEGLMVTYTKEGRLLLTAGTYDVMKMSGGGGMPGPGYWTGSNQMRFDNYAHQGVSMQYIPNSVYVPGAPVYTMQSARYYTTTYFKMLLDPTTLKPTRGRVGRSVADQVKDYVDDTGRKRATNQFAIGNNQYYGYYDQDMLSYVIEQIRLF